jgi:hypothetical protein
VYSPPNPVLAVKNQEYRKISEIGPDSTKIGTSLGQTPGSPD